MVAQFRKVAVAALLVGLGGQVSADTWQLTGAAPSAGITSIQAYANTGTVGVADTSTNTVNNAASQTIATAAWVGQTNQAVPPNPPVYYGGVTNADKCGSGACDTTEGASPEHAIDNNQRYEMVMLNFASNVNLASLLLSWYQFDGDFTVMAYTGSSTNGILKQSEKGGATGIVGNVFSSSMSGWTVVGSYDIADTLSTTAVTNTSKAFANTVYSSSWLIGAYNPLVGGPKEANVDMGPLSGTGVGANTSNNGYDYIKLASVSGTLCSGNTQCGQSGNVPEPGSLALLGLGLMGVIRMRKARKV